MGAPSTSPAAQTASREGFLQEPGYTTAYLNTNFPLSPTLLLILWAIYHNHIIILPSQSPLTPSPPIPHHDYDLFSVDGVNGEEAQLVAWWMGVGRFQLLRCTLPCCFSSPPAPPAAHPHHQRPQSLRVPLPQRRDRWVGWGGERWVGVRHTPPPHPPPR